ASGGGDGRRQPRGRHLAARGSHGARRLRCRRRAAGGAAGADAGSGGGPRWRRPAARRGRHLHHRASRPGAGAAAGGAAVIRLAYWIVLSLLATLAIAWLISLPGTLTLEFMGLRMQPRLGVAAFLVIGFVIAVLGLWTLLGRVFAAPYHLARRARDRRRERGFTALSDGFIALQGGDAARARLLAREARSNLPQNPAAQLLEARSDLALGDMQAARGHYRALVSNRKTALAALAGLYDQARAQGRATAALTFAQKAIDLPPHTAWASAAVFDDLARKGQWEEALAMVTAEPAVTREEKMRKRRRQAVIETARAAIAEPTEPLAA